MATSNFFAHGKLLLTAEYLVVKGAKALAIPTKMGQHMEVKDGSGSELIWKSLDHEGKEWFSAKYDLMGFDCMETSDEEKAQHLRKILRAVCQDNSDFLSKWKKYRVTTKLDFPRDWGLGSSSTLIHTLCEWAEANPFLVYFDLFNGSGYDIACADADGPITYEFTGDSLHYESCDWNPKFSDQLFLIHLGQKQSSEASLKSFLKKRVKKADIQTGNELTEAFIKAGSLSALEKVIQEHEKFMGGILDQCPLKQGRFPDYWGEVKSLGAWGGDMALVTSARSPKDTEAFFKEQGISHFSAFNDIVVND